MVSFGPLFLFLFLFLVVIFETDQVPNMHCQYRCSLFTIWFLKSNSVFNLDFTKNLLTDLSCIPDYFVLEAHSI